MGISFLERYTNETELLGGSGGLEMERLVADAPGEWGLTKSGPMRIFPETSPFGEWILSDDFDHNLNFLPVSAVDEHRDNFHRLHRVCSLPPDSCLLEPFSFGVLLHEEVFSSGVSTIFSINTSPGSEVVHCVLSTTGVISGPADPPCRHSWEELVPETIP